MSKIKHIMSVQVEKETATERMEKRLIQLKKRHGMLSKNINAWLTAGFMLSEMGGAVMTTFVALDENGEMKGMSQQEKALLLISLLKRVTDDIKPAPVEQDKPASAPVMNTLKNLGTDYSA